MSQGAPSRRSIPRAARAGGAVGAALIAAVGSGCADSGTGSAEKAEATVATLLETCAAAEGEAVLALLTPPTREEVIRARSVTAGCDRVLELGVESDVEGPTVFGEAVVESVDVSEEIGTATVRTPDGQASELELENSGDQWLVSNPGP